MALMIWTIQKGIPSELLMSWRIHTTLPILDSQLQSFVPDYADVREKESKKKSDNKWTLTFVTMQLFLIHWILFVLQEREIVA